jgi:hypothetical protein
MTVQGPRKGEPSLLSMRYGLRLQPARLVRGSSRRIMFLRFRPANIRVINRRVSSSLLSALLSKPETLKAHQRERVPATPPVEGSRDARTVLAKQGYASPRQKRAPPCLLRAVPASDLCEGRLRRQHFSIREDPE